MTVIGLTGSFGTGKSFVASVFKGLGAHVVDADNLAREAVKKGTPAYRKIVRFFGSNILDKNKNIDRPMLAKIVFGNQDKLKKLNRIVHPVVIKSIKQNIKVECGKHIVIDAPLLIEAGLTRLVDKLVVVKSSKATQIKRCMKKSGIKKADVLKRLNNQIPLVRKVLLADFIVDNDGTKSGTKEQVKKIWREIR